MKKNKTKLIKQILKNLNKPAQKLLKSLINSKEKIRKGIRFIEEIEKIHSPKTTYDINLNNPESRFMNDKKRSIWLQLQFTNSNRLQKPNDNILRLKYTK